MWSLESYVLRERNTSIVKVEVELTQIYHHEDRVARFVWNVGVYAPEFT
jgi:hypothetical protein